MAWARLSLRKCFLATGLAFGLCAASACSTFPLSTAGQSQPTAIQVEGFTLPFSNLASAEANAIFARRLTEPPFDFGSDIALARSHYGAFNNERLEEMRHLYRTNEHRETWNGVVVDIVDPAVGIAPKNADKVLINVHGGAFMWGSGSGALVEAIPIAATGRIKVVTVDYRLAPEHRFPVASEDIAAVYRHLLTTYRPENIGIYGCSAGGIITAQVTAWLAQHQLPRPGAIGTLCGTGAPYGGDSVFTSAIAGGQKAPRPGAAANRRSANPYLDHVSLDDALAFPEGSDEVLGKFPPTLLLAGGRDFAASVLTSMHRRLAQLDVESELYLFDGLWHAFFMYPDMPESQEAYDLIVRFFDRHLGKPDTAVNHVALQTELGRATPADLFGELFIAVQSARIFPDSKTFADATPRRTPSDIMTDYRAQLPAGSDALRSFVAANFMLPDSADAPAPMDTSTRPLRAHIGDIWPMLTRPALTEPPAGTSALALAHPYVVPGGRFREIYYWDSYFTMLGLKADGRQDLVEAMILNFQDMVVAYGHVPNGARSYYLSRSQPPFLSLMIALSEQKDRESLTHQLDAMLREHAYWMAGAGCAKETGACDRVVRMPDGALLNRYWDDRDTPRDESWAEDVETAQSAPDRPAASVYRDLRAAAESGWDFSSRWLDDPTRLATIRTSEIVPVDLNSLLWALERQIVYHCTVLGDPTCAEDFDQRAIARREAIHAWLWRAADMRFGDWDRRTQQLTPHVSATMLYPLFVGVATPAQASAIASLADKQLVAPGGLRTTLIETQQQWDRPNGWAPLQWIAIDGLTRYDHDALAERIASRWIETVDRVYRETGKMLEKYNVDARTPGGGGEYPLQDGFGWTNGVTRALLDRYPSLVPIQ